MKIALYRKYRPKSFEEMLGQEHVTQTLKNAVKDIAHSHAYLFTGPRGVGKTSAARLLATAINCLESKTGDPCGRCNSCKSILENKAIDIIEIDAASNRGIDEIRELKEKVRFSPNNLKYKVFIIDEVHMLTKEAFNALLKTLEEPPSYAVFILATTETHKVPQTILSRCQRFDFKRITLKDLVKQLQDIAKKENIKITKEALGLISQSSEGGFRDAISSLDQISSFKNTEITETDIIDLLGMSDYKSLILFAEYLKDKKSKEAIILVNDLAEKGVDIPQFTKNIIEFLRKILLVKVLGEKEVEIADEHLLKIKEIANGLKDTEITYAIEKILENSNKFKNPPLPQLPLELSIVEICSFENASGANSKINQDSSISQIESKPKEVYSYQIKKEITQAVESKKEDKKVTEDKTKAEEPKNNRDEIVEDKNNGVEHWQDFMLELKGKNSSCHALLKVCKYKFQNNELHLTFPFKFHKERVEERKSKKVIEETLKRVYNRSYEIVCNVKEMPKEEKREEKELVNSALEIFGGKIVK